MNGQTARLETCRSCITNLSFDAIIETGAYRGVTTEWLASFFPIPVYSIEINPKYYFFSKKRLNSKPNVKFFLGSSEDVLSSNLKTKLKNKNLFIYIDAHWEKYLPIREEITTIDSISNNYILLIDDFKVPNDNGYEYDDYGQAGSCTLDYIINLLNKELKIFFPSVPSKKETGYKRGYVFIAKGKENINFLDKIDLLIRSN
tara:strand:- start:124 stop:729 length:606 start_codon:yes stop_codon:yes gene_type:complete